MTQSLSWSSGIRRFVLIESLISANLGLGRYERFAMSRFLDWLLLVVIVGVSLASPLIVLEFVSGKY